VYYFPIIVFLRPSFQKIFLRKFLPRSTGLTSRYTTSQRDTCKKGRKNKWVRLIWSYLYLLIKQRDIILLLNCTLWSHHSTPPRSEFAAMLNFAKDHLFKRGFKVQMAVAPQSAVDALGYVPGQRYVPGPSYTRFVIVDTWNGSQVIPTVMHLPLSSSLVSSLILQCDPDQVIRWHKK